MPADKGDNDRSAAEHLISLAEASVICGLAKTIFADGALRKMRGTKTGRNWVTSEAPVGYQSGKWNIGLSADARAVVSSSFGGTIRV